MTRPVPPSLDMREYDQIAAWYVATRSPEVGVPEVVALARRLPPRARVLDLGCGDGVPVSRVLVDAGLDVRALDSSPAMVARYQTHFPGVPVQCERAQDAHVADASLAAVVAWGVLFHLPADEQEAVIQNVGRWLTPGGRFLFTAGEDAGVREGTMAGVSFTYVSLGAAAYRRALESAGLRLDRHHTDAWDNHVYLAVKPEGPAAP